MCCMQKQMTSPSLAAALPNKFGSAVVKLLHFHHRVCFLPIPCNTGMLKVWSLFFLTSAAVQGSAVARKWYFGPKQVSSPTDSRLLQQGEMHSLFPLGSVFCWRVHGNFTAKFSKRSVKAPFVSFVSWWLACISLTQVNMPTNVPPAHFPPWQSASWKSTPWKCMGKHWHYQDPALSTLQPHTPTTPPRTTLLLKKWRTLMVRGASER